MVKAVVGANWGDEGKGKITDMLAEEADIIVRFQGGANAGHTIINNYGKFALHTLPHMKRRGWAESHSAPPSRALLRFIPTNMPR